MKFLINFNFFHFFLLSNISIWGIFFNNFIGGNSKDSLTVSGIFISYIFWFYLIDPIIKKNEHNHISFRTLFFLIYSFIFLIILNTLSIKLVTFISFLFFFTVLIFFFKKIFKIKNYKKLIRKFFFLSILINLLLFFFYLTILEPVQIFFPFIERFALTGLHLDILFHSSISNSIKNYNFFGSIINGYHEIPGYYFILNFIISIFSKTTEIEVINLFNYSHFTFFIPLIFFVIMFTQIKKNILNKYSFWILFFLFLFGFFPFIFFESSFSRTLNTSYVHLNTQLGVAFFILIIFNLHELIHKKGNSIIQSTIIFFIFVIILFTKKSFAYSLILAINLLFLYSCYYEKIKINKFYSITVLIIINSIFFITYLDSLKIYKINTNRENFYFFIHYAKGSWFYIISLTIVMYLIQKNFFLKNNSFKLQRFFISNLFFLSLFNSVGIVCLYSLLYSPTKFYGGVHYFTDAFVIATYSYYLIKSENIINNFYKKKIIRFLIIFLCFVKIFDIITYSAKSFINHTNTSFNQILTCNKLVDEHFEDTYFKNIFSASNFLTNLICIDINRKNLIENIRILKNEINNNPHYQFIQKINNFLKEKENDNINKSNTFFVINMEDLDVMRNNYEKNHIQQLCNADYFIIPGIFGFGQISLDNLKYNDVNCLKFYIPEKAFKVSIENISNFCRLKSNFNLIFIRNEKIELIQCDDYLTNFKK